MQRKSPFQHILGAHYYKRLVLVAFFVFFLFSVLFVQFFKIQILEGDRWKKAADAQHHRVVIEPFRRGLFYSNTSIQAGHPEEPKAFVTDIPKFHLYIDPVSIPKAFRKQIAERLNRDLELSKEEYERMYFQFERKSRSRRLVSWLDKKQKDLVLNWWFHFAAKEKIPKNALYFIQDYQRSYPFGKLLGQVLHTVRTEKQVDSGQPIPTGGLEMIFDRFLQGKEGKRFLLRSPRHPMETGEILSHPEDGADVHLTINHYLQAIAEEEISKAVKNANAKGGWAILMHPRTGEIYALAQYPWFDPAEYSKYFNDPKLSEHTKIKALTDPFEPASMMKPLTLAIALKANKELIKQGKKPLFSPEEKIPSANGFFPGRSKPISDVRSHRYLNMYMALQKSSNIYMARLVQRIIEQLGEKWYRDMLSETMGFGKKTGVELPSESPGMLPTPGKKYANGKLEWSVPTPFSLSFGHNLLCNSLQILRSYAIIANGGYDVQPTIVRKVVKKNRDGTEDVLLDHTDPKRIAQFRRLLEPDIASEVVKALKYVTKPGGSGGKADIYGYTEAGKSGTSEKIVGGTYSKKDHISMFIGFAPAEKPEFVLLIVIDDPEFKYIPGVGKNQHGGHCAAPAFSQIGIRTLQYLGVEPDDPYGYPVGDPRRDFKKADWMEKAENLKNQYQEWNSQ